MQNYVVSLFVNFNVFVLFIGYFHCIHAVILLMPLLLKLKVLLGEFPLN